MNTRKQDKHTFNTISLSNITNLNMSVARELHITDEKRICYVRHIHINQGDNSSLDIALCSDSRDNLDMGIVL